MISPLSQGLPGLQAGTSELAGNPLTTAQAVKLSREQGRLLLEASSTPARMPVLQGGETILAKISERLPDGRISAQIKGEPFLLNVPQGATLQGEDLRLRVATTQPLAFLLLDTDDLKPEPSPADTPTTKQSQALAQALQLAAGSEGVELETLTQPQGKLPAFQPGEWVMARVAERLPDGSAAVLVKNAAFTLKAPGDGQALRADPLMLRVRATEPVLSFTQVNLPQAAASDKSAPVSFSTASRYLSSLLASSNGAQGSTATAATLASALPTAGQLEGKPLSDVIANRLAAGLAAMPATLRTEASQAALLPNPSQPAPEQETHLKATVEKSGVFYEAHQKAWVDGRLSLDELKQEPQARLATTLTTAEASAGKHTVTPEAGHLVQRQLDTLEQHQFMYTGQAWPGQLVQWQIQPEQGGEREGNGQQEMRAWHTSLAMSLPALGGLAARLRLVGNQVQLTFDTDNPEAAALIEQYRQQLAGSMEAAGLALASLQVRHEASTG
ncbi:flagellar hook-length control protein FliK [Vogesella sp. DC21W]|uniref:Flagellar hook-length control protein FliK n=1 Tax=Vogesella aquatica TaxID=2984206 RepID=A0ABT5IWC3_9NEIS|nr:flagellar hook-length control protein FliK [Vogesella aquatica]MDC7716850.1 flagellar hook-length control protein FliK [Vogesella aquatica]